MSPYSYLFDNQKHVKLSSLTFEELDEMITQIDQDVSAFGRNQKKDEYQELIGMWLELRNKAVKLVRKMMK